MEELEYSLDFVARKGPFSAQRETIKHASKMKVADILEIQRYLDDIKDYPLLTPEEEVYLFQLYEKGDEKAFEKIVQSNLRFVIFVAKIYTGYGVPLSDLIQEGNIGLIKAVKKFDHTRGFKLISYAVYSIMNKIELTIRKSNGRTAPKNYENLDEIIDKFLQENGRFPEYGELQELCEDNRISEDCLHYYQNAKYKLLNIPLNHTLLEYKQMGIDPELLKEIFNESIPFNSYDDMIPDGNENQVTENLDYEDIQKITEAMLSKLTSYESTVIKMYYGIGCNPMTLSEIALRFGLTKERIGQIKEKGIKRLKNSGLNILKTLGYSPEDIIDLVGISQSEKKEDDNIYQ